MRCKNCHWSKSEIEALRAIHGSIDWYCAAVCPIPMTRAREFKQESQFYQQLEA